MCLFVTETLWYHSTIYYNTVSQKSCQILTDFQNFCTAGKCMKFATKPYNTTCLTLGMLLHTTLGNYKFKFSADIQQIWKKMQRNCILRNYPLQNSSVNLFAVYPFKYKLLIKILSSSLNVMLIVDK